MVKKHLTMVKKEVAGDLQWIDVDSHPYFSSYQVYDIVMRNREVIDAEVQHERDFTFDYFGFKVLLQYIRTMGCPMTCSMASCLRPYSGFAPLHTAVVPKKHVLTQHDSLGSGDVTIVSRGVLVTFQKPGKPLVLDFWILCIEGALRTRLVWGMAAFNQNCTPPSVAVWIRKNLHFT